MTRMIDELNERPHHSPTPEEVDRILARAHEMRSEAMASFFSDIRRTLADAVQATGRRRNA